MSAGEDLCKSFETYARAQPDGTCRAYKPIPTDPWTIGWGSTGQDVTSTSWWTRLKADQRFEHAWASCKAGVLRASPILAKYPNRLEAIIDFAYNCGVGAYQASTLRRKVNAEDWTACERELLKWNHSKGKVVAGLTRRRAAERVLFAQTDSVPVSSSQNNGIPPSQATTPTMQDRVGNTQSVPQSSPVSVDSVLGQVARLETLTRQFFNRHA